MDKFSKCLTSSTVSRCFYLFSDMFYGVLVPTMPYSFQPLLFKSDLFATKVTFYVCQQEYWDLYHLQLAPKLRGWPLHNHSDWSWRFGSCITLMTNTFARWRSRNVFPVLCVNAGMVNVRQIVGVTAIRCENPQEVFFVFVFYESGERSWSITNIGSHATCQASTGKLTVKSLIS